jgi:uncharacterized alkaline shock family protein YloU
VSAPGAAPTRSGPAPSADPPATARPGPADDRGRLDVHPAVLRKIVQYAADQVPGTLHRGRSLAGFEVGDAGIKAKVSTSGVNTVDVRLDLALAYPAPVRESVAAVRDRVAGELERLAGYRVRTLAVTVTGLRGASAAGPRLQ